MLSFLPKGGGKPKIQPATITETKSLYKQSPSFIKHLPWTDYNSTNKSFTLEDGYTPAALWDITPVGSEARTDSYMEGLRYNIQMIMTSAIPEEYNDPWVVQVYAERERNLSYAKKDIRTDIAKHAEDSKLTKDWLRLMDQHLDDVCNSNGIFIDDQVSRSPWSGSRFTVKACIFRKRKKLAKEFNYANRHPEDELKDVATKIEASFAAAGFRFSRCNAEDLYNWMAPWFNPGIDLNQHSYPGDNSMPFGISFSESLLFSVPETHKENKSGIWYFKGIPHKCLTVERLTTIPDIGSITAEKTYGEDIYAIFDKFPSGTRMALTVIIESQDRVKAHLGKLIAASIGDSADAATTIQQAEIALKQIATGNKMFRVLIAFYIKADTEEKLLQKEDELNGLLASKRFNLIPHRNDLIGTTSYTLNLPMKFCPRYDTRESKLSRPMMADQIAAIWPLYGRSTGTGNFGINRFNRGGELQVYDPMGKDRVRNGHAVYLGPTGSGKTALLINDIQGMMAKHRPFLFIIDPKDSFENLAMYYQSKGLTVNYVSMAQNKAPPMPPFGTPDEIIDSTEFDQKKQTQTGQDFLNDAFLATKLMMTGGRKNEEEKLTMPMEHRIKKAIIRSAENHRGQPHNLLSSQISEACHQLSKESERPEVKGFYDDMADSIDNFCTGFRGHLFDKPGILWPESDVTLIELDTLGQKGWEETLAIVYIGLMTQVIRHAKKHKNSARATLCLTDECQVVTVNPLLNSYLTWCLSQSRSYGLWIWMATQNLENFPSEARKMLTNLEWWNCLVMPKDQMKQLFEFKELPEEDRGLIEAATKSPRKYTEGVLFSDGHKSLFRNVPIPFNLALGMTEKDEKDERQKIMKQKNCTELEAMHLVAERIRLTRIER